MEFCQGKRTEQMALIFSENTVWLTDPLRTIKPVAFEVTKKNTGSLQEHMIRFHDASSRIHIFWLLFCFWVTSKSLLPQRRTKDGCLNMRCKQTLPFTGAFAHVVRMSTLSAAPKQQGPSFLQEEGGWSMDVGGIWWHLSWSSQCMVWKCVKSDSYCSTWSSMLKSTVL